MLANNGKLNSVENEWFNSAQVLSEKRSETDKKVKERKEMNGKKEILKWVNRANEEYKQYNYFHINHTKLMWTFVTLCLSNVWGGSNLWNFVAGIFTRMHGDLWFSKEFCIYYWNYMEFVKFTINIRGICQLDKTSDHKVK